MHVGEDKDGTKAEGNLTIPEVSHEQSDGLSDYVVRTTHVSPFAALLSSILQYDWSLKSSSSPAVDALFALAKSKLPSLLADRFNSFRGAMLDTHGKDLTVIGTPGASGAATPATPPPAPGSSLSKPVSAKDVSQGITNSAVVNVESSFMASADELFHLLTDENLMPRWSRSAAQVICILFMYLWWALTDKVVSSPNRSRVVRLVCLGVV